VDKSFPPLPVSRVPVRDLPFKRLVFLTDSLELGKSGVGDVTRHLAAELSRRGHYVLLLSINDRSYHSETPFFESLDEGRIRLGRFSNALPWKSRAPIIRRLITEFQPDLISLQFVCYGYETRGLTFFINPWIQRLLEGFTTQIMFHELWIGQNLDATFKERVFKWLQSQAVLALLRRIQPKMVHASNPTYVDILHDFGISAKCLPLPSAISIAPMKDQEWFYQHVATNQTNLTAINRSEYWLFGFFGTLHPIWPPEPFLSYVRQAAEQSGKVPIFCAIGHLGAGEPLWDRLSQEHGTWSKWVKFGVQPEQRVSQFFQEIDYGVATTPWQIIGKSSSAVTMLEHGVPVIVNRSVQFRSGAEYTVSPDPLLIRMDSSLPQVLLQGRSRGVPQERTPSVASQFLEDCFGGLKEKT